MIWEIETSSIKTANFVTIFFEIFTEEQLMNFLLKLQNSKREEELCVITKDIEPGWVTYDLESIDPDPTFWNYEELCMIYLFEYYEVILRTNPKGGIAEFE